MANWNDATIKEFHSKEGKGVGPFGDRLMLLTTVGARSREERISPLMYHRDGERYIVVASKGGAPDNPAWYLNLKANPDATIEIGRDSYPVTATEATDGDREQLWRKMTAVYPTYDEYQKKTTRRLPVLRLTRR